MADLTKIARTALGSAAIAAMPAAAGAATLDTEPNNTFATAQPATVGDTISGTLCLNTSFPCNFPDLADFFHYTGLPAGGSFDFAFNHPTAEFGNLLAGRYTSSGPAVDSVSSGGSTFVHLTGTVPGSGELFFGITPAVTPPGTCCAEGYTARLTVTGARVSAPAAIVLLAAGLAAVGLDTVRRRKRS
jgi:hypothetical protein